MSTGDTVAYGTVDWPTFEREAYIAMADEFDPMGADPSRPPRLEDFDPVYIDAARDYARRHGIPLPWVLGSLDLAIQHVHIVERREGGLYGSGD